MERVDPTRARIGRIAGVAASVALVSAITLGAILLRLPGIDSRSLWVDEAMSVIFAARPLPDLLQLLVTEDIHPPLYPVLLHYWMVIAGTSELAARLPSLVFGVLLVPLIYLTGRRLEAMAMPGERAPVSLVGLVGAIIAATSAFYIGYSQEARNYMAVTLMGLLSSYLLLRALAYSGRRDWVAYVLATAAALYTHYTAFLLLVFHLLFVILTFRAYRGAWKGWLLALVGVVAVYLPWLGYSIEQLLRISDYWSGTLQLETALRTSLLLFVAGGGTGSRRMLLPLVVGLALLGLGLLALVVSGVWRRSSQHILFLLLYLLVPSALLFAVAYYRPKFDPRYLLVVTPAFYLTLAWGMALPLQAAISRRASLLTRVVLIGLGLGALAGVVSVSAAYGEPAKLTHVGDGSVGATQEYGDYRALVAYLESQSQPGDGVVIMMNTYHPYDYYSRLRIPRYEMEPFDDFDGAIIRLNRMAEKHDRLWFILWQTQWADPAGYVMHAMEEQAKEVTLDATFGGIGLRLFELTPGQQFSYYPAVQYKKDAFFGDRLLEFWGWNASATSAPAGSSVRFDLHWRPLKKVTGKLKSKILMIDGNMHQWAVVDEIMVSPYYASDRWKEQEILHDRHTLAIPKGTPPGDYQLVLLVYDENTMKDIPAESFWGEKYGTLLPLGTMSVTPTPADAFPAAAQAPVAEWWLGNDRLELLGARMERTLVRPGDRVWLELTWRAPASMGAIPMAHVALLDEKGQLLSEQRALLAPGYPSDRWRAGEAVLSRHWLTAPTVQPVSKYGVAVAMTGPREDDPSVLRYTQVMRLDVLLPTPTPTVAGAPTTPATPASR